MALAIASGTESNITRTKNNHNDTMTNPQYRGLWQVNGYKEHNYNICRWQLQLQKDNISAYDSLEAGNICD